ncbi:hypothetical protein GcM1_207004 [Golovinomyces cichoracearum]|uniref:Uncharacterized protein n=1 Tax=Golovinomyces cichoracearum TaxID=62708 RepID=A0A420IWC9_9PEZI|nr:hypothetical protein GcM1_207004 [Golovinomyces cichoracearum]
MHLKVYVSKRQSLVQPQALPDVNASRFEARPTPIAYQNNHYTHQVSYNSLPHLPTAIFIQNHNIPQQPEQNLPSNFAPNSPPQLEINSLANPYRYKNNIIPSTEKYNSKTDILEYLEDLEKNFVLFPLIYATDRLKVIAALENSAGHKENETDSSKQWARVELRFDQNLRDSWLAFRDKLRERYQNFED